MVQGAAAQSAFEITILSSRPDMVSGGDAVVQVRLPSTAPVQQVTVLRNRVDVTSAFVPGSGTTLHGLVGGLKDGVNTLAVATRVAGEVSATLFNTYCHDIRLLPGVPGSV